MEEKIAFQVRERGIVLAGGIGIMVFTLFILVAGICHPSTHANLPVFYSVLAVMLLCGAGVCQLWRCRKIKVRDMELEYVNWLGKKKPFTLNDIGYFAINLTSSNDSIILYNLLGEKLCKLSFAMEGSWELVQYLLDNGIKAESRLAPVDGYQFPLFEASLQESSVCEEEIEKNTQQLYGQVQQLFNEWEKGNKKFQAYWEYGFVIRENVCMLEAYLKKNNEYVIDRKGNMVAVQIPYLVKSKSYQIGEGERIRKTKESFLTDWLKQYLFQLTEILPRQKYHTEAISLPYELTRQGAHL